ncbi:MAG TPA: S8 family serine peptidase [Anaerolineae bacterium]|nr:S8 family serine peptidase [Anaerolineae bacterium]
MIKNPMSKFRNWPGWVVLLLVATLIPATISPVKADEPPARHPKLDSTLAQLVTASQSSGEEMTKLAEDSALKLADGRIQVQLVTDAPNLAAVKAAVTEAGGEVTGVAYNDTLVQGWLPVDSLEAVAGRPEVFFIRRPTAIFPLETLQVGNSTTEGLGVINGLAWHSAGHTGSGVKVGILDLGFIGYTGLLGTDLPQTVVVKNFVDGESETEVASTTEHGTACAEVIHDIAPGAELYLAKVGTDLDIVEAVAWLISQQVDIISSSIGLYNASAGDGTGFLADLVNQARASGILWVTAAGNDRESHWGGVYNNLDGDSFHEFANGDDVNCFTFTLLGGGCSTIFFGQVNIFVRWSDWDQGDQDFDLHLVVWNGTAWESVASSVNVQDGSPGQTPTEWITATIFDFRPYGFRLERVSGNRPVNFEVFTPGLISFGFGLQETLHARSLANLADSPGAITVAALNVASPHVQEFYSSEGPANGPGGAAIGGFTKPDLSGFANVSTQSYGAGVFNGTSSATPHVAGAAALVLGANPGLTPDQIQAFLSGQAVDMGDSGLDTQFGHGRLYLGDPPTGTSTPPLLSIYYLPLIFRDKP